MIFIKKYESGYALVELLVVTIFVAGVLIYLIVQFTNLSNSYIYTFKYNTVEGLYSLRNISDYIESDVSATNYIQSNVVEAGYLDITDCSIFTDTQYCSQLLNLENVKNIIVTTNSFNSDVFSSYDEQTKQFINKISSTGSEKYRLIVAYNDLTYATLRFTGDINE